MNNLCIYWEEQYTYMHMNIVGVILVVFRRMIKQTYALKQARVNTHTHALLLAHICLLYLCTLQKSSLIQKITLSVSHTHTCNSSPTSDNILSTFCQLFYLIIFVPSNTWLGSFRITLQSLFSFHSVQHRIS